MHMSDSVPPTPAIAPRPVQTAARVTYSRFSFWQPRAARPEPRTLPAEPLDLDQRVRQSGEW